MLELGTPTPRVTGPWALKWGFWVQGTQTMCGLPELGFGAGWDFGAAWDFTGILEYAGFF